MKSQAILCWRTIRTLRYRHDANTIPPSELCGPALSRKAAAADRGPPLRTAAWLWGRAAGICAAAVALSAPIRRAGEEEEEAHPEHEEEVGHREEALLRPYPSSPSCAGCHTRCRRRWAETESSCTISHIHSSAAVFVSWQFLRMKSGLTLFTRVGRKAERGNGPRERWHGRRWRGGGGGGGMLLLLCQPRRRFGGGGGRRARRRRPRRWSAPLVM